MPSVRRDSRLIDALEALSPNLLRETVWRIVREGRDPCACNASGGRWDDETFDVLYTSRKRDGAIAEMYFHLRRGQPLIPSRVHYRLHELQIDLKSVLDLSDRAQLTALGVDMSLFGQLSYEERASILALRTLPKSPFSRSFRHCRAERAVGLRKCRHLLRPDCP